MKFDKSLIQQRIDDFTFLEANLLMWCLNSQGVKTLPPNIGMTTSQSFLYK